MNSEKPIQVAEKISYLKEKIDCLHWKCIKADDFLFRLKFQSYINNCIDQILRVSEDDKHLFETQTRVQEKNQGKLYTIENQKIDAQRKLAAYKNNEINTKQKNLQLQNLQMRIQNKDLQIEVIKKNYEDSKQKILLKNTQLSDRNKFLEKELEKLVKLNTAQDQQIQKVKAQRALAQKNQFQMRQKYDRDFQKVQKFGEKKPKYFDRNSDGLRCVKMFTNTGGKQKVGEQKKYIILDLPTNLEVNKIIYGIRLGLIHENQFVFFEKLQLYEKQITQVRTENEKLILNYPKRKFNNQIILDKYIVKKPEIVVMLYGKGDSINVHQ